MAFNRLTNLLGQLVAWVVMLAVVAGAGWLVWQTTQRQQVVVQGSVQNPQRATGPALLVSFDQPLPQLAPDHFYVVWARSGNQTTRLFSFVMENSEVRQTTGIRGGSFRGLDLLRYDALVVSRENEESPQAVSMPIAGGSLREGAGVLYAMGENSALTNEVLGQVTITGGSGE